jgi:hypothetical protein
MPTEMRQKLAASLQEHGVVDPFIVNSNKDRHNIVIGGHQRLAVAIELGMETVPVVYVDIADIEVEKKLNIRLNKISSEFDPLKLRSFNPDVLQGTGFTAKDITRIFKDVEVVKPEVEFTQELLEEHNYIVLVFDNEVDWLQANTLLDLKPVQALHSEGEFRAIGTGRVIKWADAIKKIRSALG